MPKFTQPGWWVFALALTMPLHSQSTRDHVAVVGSSTVYPFATVVAERFGRRTGLPAPKIEATGSGGGFKQFCSGIGIGSPDITNSSRRIKPGELDMCRKNGVDTVVEVLFGYDGIVLANASKAESLSLTREQLWQALARVVPAPDDKGQSIPNPYRRWKDIDPALPDIPITVFGPPPTSGTRDAFVELVMVPACPFVIDRTEPARVPENCQLIREDGVFIEVGESDNLVVQKLVANPAAVGLFGFSFLTQNSAVVRAIDIDGYSPGVASIASRRYPMSRPLFLYIKKAHVEMIPGLNAFIAEFTSDRAWGEEGYLVDRGLVPLPLRERALQLANLLAMSPVEL